MNKRSRRHRRHFLLFLFALAAGALILAAALRMTGEGGVGLQMAWRKLTSAAKGTTTATEFTYIRSEDGCFIPLGTGFAIGDRSGIRILDGDGQETILSGIAMTRPCGDENGSECLIYDLGGTGLSVLDSSGLIWQGESPGALCCARINSAGWVCAAGEYEGYHGAVTVYNLKGEAVYRWYCGTGYVISAAVSPGCDMLAVLTVEQTGSTVHFMRLDAEDELSTYTVPGAVLLDIAFQKSSVLTVVSGDGLYTVSTDGSPVSSVPWDGTLAAYSFSGDGFTVLSWEHTGTVGGLETVDARGDVISRLELTGSVLSLSAAGRYVAVRYTDRVSVYNKHLELLYETAGMADAVAVLVKQDGYFLAVGETKAELYGE